jgi:3-hydroxyisobutyrate dehydrogenase-like beta-hydroxyacid dehydrogenase
MSAAKAKKAVGVIGLGIMGGAFSRNLIKSGWRVVGFDISAAKRKELARAGVEIASSARAVAAACPIVITSLPKPEALMATAKEIAATNLPPRIVAECSTFTIEDKEKAERVLRKAGHTMLDCPVSGTGSQANTGDLVIYASGDTKAIGKIKPVFAGFSRKVYDVGAFGDGSRMKYVANLLVAINNVASAEAMVMGMKAGLDPKTVSDDGAKRLHRRHHEVLGLAEGHGRDRRLRQKNESADAVVFRDAAGLCRGAEAGPRRGRHRGGVCGAGRQSQGQAAQVALTASVRAGIKTILLSRCGI